MRTCMLGKHVSSTGSFLFLWGWCFPEGHLYLRWSYVSQLSITVRCLHNTSQRSTSLVLVHGVRGLSPWLAGSTASRSVVRHEHHGTTRQRGAAPLLVARKRRGKGWGLSILPGHTSAVCSLQHSSRLLFLPSSNNAIKLQSCQWTNPLMKLVLISRSFPKRLPLNTQVGGGETLWI